MNGILLSVILACGTERVDVKNLTDSAAKKLQHQLKAAKVEDLTKLQAPKWSEKLPRQPSELQTYEVTARVVEWKLETDGDVHVVLAGDTGERMIAEFPADACVAKSHYAKQLRAARAEVLKLGQPGPRLKRPAHPTGAHLVGVLHFDKLHGQDGAAPNGAELHPVLSFELTES